MRRPGKCSREQLLTRPGIWRSRAAPTSSTSMCGRSGSRSEPTRSRPSAASVPAADGHSVISRLPIRLRLMLPFALGMAVVLAATGFLIYNRVAATLLSSVDQSLRGQADEAARHVGHDRAILDRDAPGSASVGQLVAADGHVLETTPKGLPPLVSGGELRAVLAGERASAPGRSPASMASGASSPSAPRTAALRSSSPHLSNRATRRSIGCSASSCSAARLPWALRRWPATCSPPVR